MKKIIIFISVIILILCLNLNLYSSLLSSAQKMRVEDSVVKNKIELEVIWEKQFDEPVVDVIFDEVEVTVKEAKIRGWKNLEGKKDTQLIMVDYPKTIFISDKLESIEKDIKEIKFNDKKGTIVKHITINKNKREGIIVSPNKKYILVSRKYDDISKNEGAILFKNDGTEVWRKEKGSFTSVSDQGYTITGFVRPDGSSKPFIIYNPNGKKIKEIHLGNDTFDAGGKFSEDGKYFIIYEGFMPTQITILNLNGKIDFKQNVEKNVLKVFPYNQGIILGVEDIKNNKQNIECFDWNGNIKWTFSQSEFSAHIGKFSAKEKRILIYCSDGYIRCLDILSGKIVWKQKENFAKMIRHDEKKALFSNMKIIGNNIFIEVKYGKHNSLKWSSTDIFRINMKNGNLIKKTEYPNKRISLILTDKKIFLLDIDSCKISSFEIKGVIK